MIYYILNGDKKKMENKKSIKKIKNQSENKEICGNIVGLSTPNEFLMSVSPYSIQVQDLVAVNTEIKVGDSTQIKRIWAKVVNIERINPLFPRESAQEIANEKIEVLDTILSVSREMITARCKVLGIENEDGSLDVLGYPIKPASPVYKPMKNDVQQMLLGDLSEDRKIKLGHLKTRPEVEVSIDGHYIVSRHLAILAMTGAGKTVTCRKILEELIRKEYPILIFDPHEDYINLKKFNENVEIYYPEINLLEEDESQIVKYIEDLSGESISPAQETLYYNYLMVLKNNEKRKALEELLNNNLNRNVRLKLKSIWDIRNLNDLIIEYRTSYNDKKEWNDILKPELAKINQSIANTSQLPTYYRLKAQTRKAAQAFSKMKKINEFRKIKGIDLPPPNKLGDLIKKGKTSIICFSGYSIEIRQSFANSILSTLLELRINNKIPRFLVILEEAQNFVPSRLEGVNIQSSVGIIKQIATEGRKFGIGLILISQRPSRVDPTVLSQCNSFIIMRIVNPSDQQYIKSTIETIGKEEAGLLPNLNIGEAIISGQCVSFPILLKIEPGVTKGIYEEIDAFQALKDWSPD